MTKLLEFLIVSLKTLDGYRDTAKQFIEHYWSEQAKKKDNKGKHDQLGKEKLEF